MLGEVDDLPTVLVVNKLQEASRAKSFHELWHSLNNDQLSDLRRLLLAVTGRDLNPFFTNATPEDWSAMANLVTRLGPASIRLNTVLRDVDWANRTEFDAALENAQHQVTQAPSEDLGVTKYLIEEIRNYRAFKQSTSFGKYRLLEFKSVASPPVLDERPYDIFVCYKISRHATQAALLVDRLKALGHRVWFDLDVLNKMQNRPEVFEKEHLISILTNAVQHSRCTIIFEAVMHAVELSPGETEEQSLADRTTMKFASDALLAWDWQILEISATKCGIAIHPNTVAAFRSERGKAIWAKSFHYHNDDELMIAVKTALSLFDAGVGA